MPPKRPLEPTSMNQILSQVFDDKLYDENPYEPQETPPARDAATDAATEAFTEPDADATPPPPTTNKELYEGLDWERVPDLQIAEDALRTYSSWVYRFGWRVWNRKTLRINWLCKYCHTHRRLGGLYDTHQATSSVQRHLAEPTYGHGFNQHGPIKVAKSGSILMHMQVTRKMHVPQDVANELAISFSKIDFLQHLTDWVISDNQALRVIENPDFGAMIASANPLAEEHLWSNHQSLRDHIICEYRAYLPTVIDYLHRARSKIHVSFDNWTSTGGKLAITGICVHHLDAAGVPQDYILGLPNLTGPHSGTNIAAIVSGTFTTFQLRAEKLGYFVLDNAPNNDTAMEVLGVTYNFSVSSRRLRCSCHICNLGAQMVLFGKDKESFGNSQANLPVTIPVYPLTFGATANSLVG